MEMHVVNTLIGQKKDETPKYLVLAYLFKMGKQEPFIELFLDLIPEEENQTRDVNLNLLTSGITNEEQLKQEFRSFYHYKGSLTTPPYTESVDWYVLSNIYEASPEQIQRINELEGDNARHIQAVYGREIDEN
jgi:carbonic anhydrase